MTFTKAQGTHLGLQIRQWLTSSRQGSPDGELLNFINDLENAHNVGVWAGVNYERILPFRAILPGVVRWLALARNAMIFLPIVVTWIALESAASSWDPTSTNFLKHWQQMDGIFSFRNVAYFDAFIIFMLVVLTVITGVLEESNSGRLNLERQHQGLMIALERDLSGYRYLSLQDINNAAADTLTSLQGSTQSVENAARSFADSALQAHDAIVGANDVVHRTFAPAVQRLDDTITALSNAADVHKDMVTLVQTVQSDFATQMSTLRQGVIDVLSSIDSRMSQVMQNVDGQISSAVASLASSSQGSIADVSRTAQAVASSASQQIGQQMQSITGSFDDALRELTALATSIDGTISGLNVNTNKVMVYTATVADDMKIIADAIREMRRDLGR